MKKNLYSTLSFSIFLALYAEQSFADLRNQCLSGVPHFIGEVVTDDVNNLPVYIEADDVEITQTNTALYQGNVIINQGNRQLQTETARILQSTADSQRFAYAENGFDYKDNLIQLKGQDARFNLNDNEGNLTAADYQFVGRQGRGTAEEAQLNQGYRLLKNATFTSCLPNDNAWEVEASEVKQYIKEEYAEMWHTRFKVAGVPIFYSPYFQLPIGDRRRSGFLMPQAGSSSSDGYWYAQPYYLNIAPNYDATIMPKYMSHRGWQMLGEFRYLNALGNGSIAGEYIEKDRYDDYFSENKSRHLFRWVHNAKLFDDWRLNINYTRVSDRYYFSDFTSQYGNSTDGYTTQTAHLAYYQPNYNVSISAKQYQVLDDVSIEPYKALPQIDFNYYKNDLVPNWLDFKLFAQSVRFDNDSSQMPTAWRFHIEPSLNLPIANRYGSLNIETKLYATHYEQRKGSAAGAEEVERSVNRFLPQVKIDLQTVLASQDNLFDGYTQTIEPHIQYLYRPYRNQSNIGSKYNTDYLGFGYDSALLQQDYFSLFRDRRYSGLDRIASANQFTFGGTTRFYDNDANERFNLSLGQILYINESRIDESADNRTSGRSSSWSLESNWKISPQWNWRGSYQYDTRLDEISLANSTLEYNPSGNNLVQLSYRYASKSYIDQNLTSGANRYNQDIKQIGTTVAWELTDNIAFIGRYYQDLALKKAVEQYVGVQYNSCCWAVGVGVRRYLTSKANKVYSSDRDVFHDNSVNLTFELRGLGTNDHHNGIVEMLNKGMLPYVKPFDL